MADEKLAPNQRPAQDFTNGNGHGDAKGKDKQRHSDNDDKSLSRRQRDRKNPPGGYASDPVPYAPPGYTVKITFHRASNLPMADLRSWSADPYIQAELKTSLKPRHEQDPPLRFRTKTVWKNTNPSWEQEWILGHVPSTGFKLKARVYDEDQSDRDDRLGNAHIDIDCISDKWVDIHKQAYKIQKRAGSWRAYSIRAVAACLSKAERSLYAQLFVSIEVLGKTAGDEGGRCYTIGPNYWYKHYSPLLGRLVGSRSSDTDETGENGDRKRCSSQAGAAVGIESRMNTAPLSHSKQVSRHDFEANQFQLRGPVPPELYHRYVEFRPIIASMFTKKGVTGFILSKALHHQHLQIYNFNRNTRSGVLRALPPEEEMTNQFLDLVHYDIGGRIFTYVLTLDALMRFTETGKEFGIDLLSKHTMHSDVSIYIAFSGEFFIRRLKHPHRKEDMAGEPSAVKGEREGGPEANITHPNDDFGGGPPQEDPPRDARYYELVIDNDSGTYRPNAKLLPLLRTFLEVNFPGLKIVTLDCAADKELMEKLKKEQRDKKKAEGSRKVYTQLSRSGSLSSEDEERLDRLLQRDRQGPSEPQDAKHKHQIGEAIAPFLGNHSHARNAIVESRL